MPNSPFCCWVTSVPEPPISKGGELFLERSFVTTYFIHARTNHKKAVRITKALRANAGEFI
jgi:hypothetical protein